MISLNYPEEKKEEENEEENEEEEEEEGEKKNPYFKNKSNYRHLLLEGRNIAQFSKKHCTDEDASVSRKMMLYKGITLLQGSEDI